MLDSIATPSSEQPRMSLRMLQKNYTRNQLLTVARKLFLKRGVEHTTVGDISEAAGTSRATFYSHFPSKDIFIAELWQDLWRDICDLNVDLAETAAWSRPAVHAWLQRVSAAWSKHVQVLGHALAHPAGKFFDALTAGLDAEVEKLIASQQWDGFEADEARRRCYLLLVQLHESMEAVHCKGWKVDIESLVDSLADIWVHTCTFDPTVAFAEA